MFKLIVLVLSVSTLVSANKYAQITQQENTVNGDGSYAYQFETSNDIFVQEAGVGGVVAQGTAHWYDPDGTGVQFSYVADQNGYNPTGSHIPKPPATPPHILKALAYIKAHPYVDEWTPKALLEEWARNPVPIPTV